MRQFNHAGVNTSASIPITIKTMYTIILLKRFRTRLFALGCISALLWSCTTLAQQHKTDEAKPNIIYILADDLGYGELGCYGQEKIETPNIDALSRTGMMFTDHYAGAPVCAPSRGVLLTGKHSGHAYIRGNDGMSSRGDVWNYMAMARDSTLEGQRPLPEGTITLGTKLQEAGYKTAAVGKWGLGGPGSEGTPNKQGFDHFYGYLCQRQAHTYYPLHLYENEHRVYLNNDTVAFRTKLAENADPLNEKSYAPFTLTEYSPDLMFDDISKFIDTNHGQSFFLYWATPIPHAAIQAPKRWVDYYVDKFGDEEPYTGDKGYFPHRYPRAGYAAMVSYLDEQIGLLINQLKELGVYEKTLIVFTSDNGPTYNGGTDSPWFDSAKPFRSDYGRGKGFVYEGGIRVPMIASWPGHIESGSTTNLISSFTDMMPTFCDLAGVSPPEDIDGISIVPTLLGKPGQKTHDFLYWEFPSYGGQQAVRMGKWKIIRKGLLKKQPVIELYNLEEDLLEEQNLAEKHPDIINKALQLFQQEHEEPLVNNFKIPFLGDHKEM
ncbi:arylsulfatase [Fulvivirga sp. M361]|uniref:arylsulfatase n=1 Tax=Fulvivirga sp. M361 TaxID=2594266 RepID=UPI002103B2AF|nr:arylsulfatase [Fulvivirga sp. M361]